MHAPTAVHEEAWAFAVIQDRSLLGRLSEDVKKTIPKMEGSIHLPGEKAPHHFTPPKNVFYDAGTLIVICSKPVSRFVAADCWLAAENFMLAACAMGLGTCVIGLAVDTLNTPRWKTELNISGDITAVVPIIVGVPEGQMPVSERKEPEVLSWKTA